MKIPFSQFPKTLPTTIEDFQEVTIILFTPNLSRDAMTINLLKKENVIPENWILSTTKTIQENIVQFIFKNGVKIIVESDKIVFISLINKKIIPIQTIVTNFINAFPKLFYPRIEFSFRRLISFPGHIKAAENFIKNTLLIKGEWQNFYDVTPKFKIDFLYTIDDWKLILKINDVKFKNRQKKTKAALLFNGIITKVLIENKKIIDQEGLKIIVNKTDDYLKIFNDIVDTFFCD